MSSTTFTFTTYAAKHSPAALMPPVRPYRDFLTPCLHRRFTGAALVGLAACYVASILMSRFSILWSWFPLGPTGFRTSLLFLSVLGIFVLRIANLHVASRCTLSPAHQFVQSCFSKHTYKALGWYLFSALIFSETYIWTATADNDLSIVDNSKPYERPHLNERPIFLRSLFLLLAIHQTAYHIYADLDQVKFSGLREPQNAPNLLRAQAVPILQHATRSMILVPIPAVFAYTLLLRRTVWSWTFSFAKSIYSLPKYQQPTSFPPFIGNLILAFLGWGWVLLVLWGLANAAFDIYLAQVPLDKKARPLSAGSRDPNGTLINGLRSKKEFTSTSAFAELALITQTDSMRRQTFFRDVERADGPMWTQLITLCLGELQGLSDRINSCVKPFPCVSKQSSSEQGPADVHRLPRIATPPRQDNIFATTLPTMRPHLSALGRIVKSHGEFPGAQDPLSPRARKMFSSAVDTFMTQEQQQRFSESNLAKVLKKYIIIFLKQPYFGAAFRQTFARRVKSVAFDGEGRQGSNLPRLRNAILSLAELTVCAATEDTWGKASKDAATIIHAYVATITTIEDFVMNLEPHWTDVEFKVRDLGDVRELLSALGQSLESILEAFDGYKELGLSLKDKRLAREKAGFATTRADTFLTTTRR